MPLTRFEFQFCWLRSSGLPRPRSRVGNLLTFLVYYFPDIVPKLIRELP